MPNEELSKDEINITGATLVAAKKLHEQNATWVIKGFFRALKAEGIPFEKLEAISDRAAKEAAIIGATELLHFISSELTEGDVRRVHEAALADVVKTPTSARSVIEDQPHDIV